MRLTSSDGVDVELSPTRYQFPDLVGDGSGRDSDANWLMIRGRVALQDFSWTFEDPCLTTTEAQDLGSWLMQVVDGVAAVEPPWTIEPNVSFSLVGTDALKATLRIAFSQESSPPGTEETVRYGQGYPVDMTVSLRDLATATSEWNREVERFPVR